MQQYSFMKKIILFFEFVGLMGNYIAGIFVKGERQGRGIGKALLDHIKENYSVQSIEVGTKRVIINGNAQVPDGAIVSVLLSRTYSTTKLRIEDYDTQYCVVSNGEFSADFGINDLSWWQRVKAKEKGQLDTIKDVSDFCRVSIVFSPYLESKTGKPVQSKPALETFGQDFEKLKDDPLIKSIRHEIAKSFGGELPDPTTPDGYYIQVIKYLILPVEIDWEKDIPKTNSVSKSEPFSVSLSDPDSPRDFAKLVVKNGKPIISGASVEDSKGKALTKDSAEFLGIWVSSKWYSLSETEKKYFIKLHLDVFNEWKGNNEGTVLVFDSYLDKKVGSGNKYNTKIVE